MERNIEETNVPRKRQPAKETWKRAREKRERYCPAKQPQLPKCRHNSAALRCTSLTMDVIQNFHARYYSIPEKISQDNFTLKHIEINKVKRRRSTDNSRPEKNFSLKYVICNNITKDKVPVCRSTFLNALGITKHRVEGVVRRYCATGLSPRERRGGDRKSTAFEGKRRSVKQFIKKFKCLESHYCRGKSQRVYLCSELSIRKMWRMYDSETTDSTFKVKESYFRKIFVSCFNVGFGMPRTDVCSKCLELNEKLKYENNEEQKQTLRIEKRIHKLRAKAFFELLQEKQAGLLTFSFDCQKNFAIPRLPDQATYYSRQLYLYNFTIVQGTSKDPLKGNTFIYTWAEHEFPKGANEIASCLYHRLNNSDLSGISTIRCMADGCGGQNKNSILISMLSKWLVHNAPSQIQKIECIFPVPGHSYIPPDRVFARIEKVIKKKEILSQPEEFYELLKEHGEIFHLGRDLPDLDWKTETSVIVKPPAQWHFKFGAAKRYFIKKTKNGGIVLKGEWAYKSELENYAGVCRKGKNIGMLNAQSIPMGKPVNALKVRDVDNLLKKHYGKNWQNLDSLQMYKDIINNNQVRQEVVVHEETLCEETPEETAIRV